MSTEQSQEKSSVQTDPVITYNHMDDESTETFHYFSKSQPATGIPIWSVIIEEAMIVLLLLALITISLS